MLEPHDIPHWPALLRPLSLASTALGGLAHALETTPLHQAWLWRETARVSSKISQFSGYRVQSSRLMIHLAGVPVESSLDDTGLAAARWVFLTAAPLFRTGHRLDSESTHLELFEPLWPAEPKKEDPLPHQTDEARAGEQGQLAALVRELAAFAGTETRPVLLDLFLQFRQHATARRLPPSYARLALPLSLHQAGLVPKVAPGLLGGRLPLKTAGLSTETDPVTPWLARGLSELAKEAEAACRRLQELTCQHRAWHACLVAAGVRCHGRAPAVLDLLAATPVLSASLVARHLDCSPQGAGAMLRRLSNLGIVTEAMPRARWKIYLASDLVGGDGDHLGAEAPLSLGESAPKIDREAVEATLDELFAELERTSSRARERARTERR